jgi:hypothetical protein
MENSFIIHIETCPQDIEFYRKLDDEARKKLLNPLDAKIVAIGIRYRGQNLVSIEKTEKEMLRDFWNEWERIHKESPNVEVVGFNITNFDIPFITARSFIHDVPISPFLLKNIIDLRDKINAYRWGPTRGKLSEFAALMGTPVEDDEDVLNLCQAKNLEKLRKILARDLEIIDALHQKAHRTKIIEIKRW